MKEDNIGSSFDDCGADARILERVEAVAIKRVLARQVEKAMREKGLTQTVLAQRMRSSRMALDRLLEPKKYKCTPRRHAASGRNGRQAPAVESCLGCDRARSDEAVARISPNEIPAKVFYQIRVSSLWC